MATAVVLTTTGGPEAMRLEEIDEPGADAGQVVVEVAAAGVNFIDIYQRSGLYPQPMPGRLGLEGAGTVTAVGEGVAGLKVGDRVAWASGPGSYATHVAVAAGKVVKVPGTLGFDAAAALMLQGMTAHYLANSTSRLDDDDVALVWAAAGGVGRLLVQMAKHRGATVIACTSTADKAAEVERLGADVVLRYRDVDVAAAVKDHTNGVGADVVYDSVGQATFETSLAALRPRGLLVSYGQSSGPVEPIDVLSLAARGSVFLTRPKLDDYTATRSELTWRAGAVLDAAAEERLDVAVHATYALSDAAQAHRDLAEGSTVGKLLLTP